MSAFRFAPPRALALALLVTCSFPSAALAGAEDPPGWWGFVGIDGGLGKLSTDAPSESGKTGYQLDFRAIVSRQRPKWVLDFGIGYAMNRLKGSGNAGRIDPWISTDTYTVELSPRIRLGESKRWQLGPSIEALFGEDTTYAETQNAKDYKAFGMLASIRALYEIPVKDYDFRVGGRFGTDLIASQRQLFLVQATVQFGFRFGAKDPEYDRGTAAPKQKLWEVVRTGPKTAIIILPEASVHFETSSADLLPWGKTTIAKLSEKLLAEKARWESLDVNGHTDRRGSHELNMDLSRRRAESVRRELAQDGIADARINSHGHGPDQPRDKADNADAWARNRRVEIELQGIRDIEALIEHLEYDEY